MTAAACVLVYLVVALLVVVIAGYCDVDADSTAFAAFMWPILLPMLLAFGVGFVVYQLGRNLRGDP